MPIKPENKARYPKNWTSEIRPAILERARDKCEKCGVPNYGVAHWQHGRWWLACGNLYYDDLQYTVSYREARDTCEGLNEARLGDEPKWIVIVLTVAHLDHQPENCDPANLRAWCQRCHLDYDKHHHAANSAATRKSRKAIADLFTESAK
jgi:hypothetical protein